VDYLSIELGSLDHAVEVRIVNLAGVLLHRATYDQSLVTVPLRGFAPGVYIANVVSKDQIICRRFTVID